MSWLQYAATRRQRAATACLFLTGAALIAAAARLSYANIEPQRAKAAQRRKVLEDFIARKRAAVAGPGAGADSHPQPDLPKT
ncbi:hypothetical protein CFC21_089558 [Triticum aestivum]|uniref:Uncharacterized protein n=2 Tax=Triticum aestivum TaxID=4565 RepID=A0A9R1LCZ2_WHEAT|nr:uncharacterized protein LOC123138508 [Triticum aestivum]KAF7086245.1 hypothetical protein CFC21_089558 [Triticum aestivum]